jgi:hypothetical protein
MREKIVGYLFLSLAATTISFAATLTVDRSGGADYTDIQAAIDAAADGDTVLVSEGEYVVSSPIMFNRTDLPFKDVNVRAESGPQRTTIRMADTLEDPNLASVVVFRSGESERSVLEGFTLTGGTGTLYNFQWGDVRVGGGIFCDAPCAPRIVNCVIGENRAEYGGGVFCWNWASPGIEGSEIVRNLATGGTLTAGAGFCSSMGSSPIISRCTIAENVATGVGASSLGGGVYFQGGSPALRDCSIRRNRAGRGGGVLCSGSWSEIVGSTIEANVSFDGQGGGVCCYRGISPSLTGCRIVGNHASGGEWGSQGAGIFCGGDPQDSTIRCTTKLTNCIIAGNRSAEGDAGGGLHCYRAEPLLYNCTITANRSATRGGIYCQEATPVLTNCIVWGNTPEWICGQTSYWIAYEDPLFLDPGEFDFEAFEDVEIQGQVYQFPAFVAQVPDYHLSPGSPAIDAGTPEGAPATDLDGRLRPCEAGVDIGAYEFGDCWPTPPFLRGDANADGATDLSDAIAILVSLFDGEIMVPCEQAGDANDDGGLDISDAVYTLTFLFLDGKAIEPPVEACGMDPTDHDLPCDSFPGCP